MAKKIIVAAPSSKQFGFSRLADGEHTIKKLACFKGSFVGTDGNPVEYDVLGIFVDTDDDDLVLELNGSWKPKAVVGEDGKTEFIKAHGSLYDKLLSDLNGHTFKEICDEFNDPAKGFVGRKFNLAWSPRQSANANYGGIVWVPKADFVE